MFRRFQNRCDWNDISFRGWSQRQFNYHDQVPHHGWDSCYSGYRFVPHQTSGPIIPAVAPLHQPLPETYCKICEVKLSSYKVVEQHNKGRRHQSMLNLHNETERQRISNGLIPNSQINLVDQSKTVLKSGKKECPVNNVSSEATFVKHENLLQKDVGVTSEVPVKGCEEKPGDNTGVQGHSFKHTISGAKTGKYMKTNEGVRRPMESSKLDVNSLSDSVETLIQVPSLPVETNDQLHAVADSNINNPPKDVSSDSAAIAIRSPQVLYCNICGVQLPNDISSLKIHTNGKRHQSMLKLHTKLQVLKTSSGQIPKIQKSLVVQSGEKECSLNYTSSETTIAKNNNYLQRVTSEIPAEGPERKPRDNSGVHGHNLKRKIGGDKTGKYMKTNDGVRRPMESSKQNFNSLSKSVESPVQNSKPTLASLPGPATSQILASTPVLGSEGKEDHKIQNPTAEMSDSKESKEHHEIQNFSMETNDQAQAISQDLHVQVGSDINAQNDVSSDAKEVTIVPAKGLTASHTSEGSPAAGSNFESQIQHVLRTDTELKLSKDTADCESQNCTDEKNNEPLPSVVVELNSPSGSSTNTQTADACFKVEQRMDILPNKSDITKLSQVAVCLKCGDIGFPETRVFCNKCLVYALHRYCLDGPVIFTDDVTWFCEDCEPTTVDRSFHDQCTLIQSEEIVSLNSAKPQAGKEPKNCIQRVENKQEPQNIVAETKFLFSENHSLSHRGFSKCDNNSEKGKKSQKQCKSIPKDDADTREGSMIVTIQPVADPVWKGSLCLLYPSFETVIRLLGHISTTACSKVLEETRLLPDVLCPDLLQRSVVWPNSFIEHGPTEESIALYFFPDDESVERVFSKLVDDMICSDLAMRAEVENAELLVFPSTLLPIQYKRFQEKYYLWGVFRSKKTLLNTNDAVCREVTSASSSTVTQ